MSPLAIKSINTRRDAERKIAVSSRVSGSCNIKQVDKQTSGDGEWRIQAPE